MERLPHVPSILPPAWPFSTLMPHTASSWDSCGHLSAVPCCPRGSTEPCITISHKTVSWLNWKHRDAGISLTAWKQKVAVHLFIVCLCLCTQNLFSRHSIINYCWIKPGYVKYSHCCLLISCAFFSSSAI